MMIWRLLASVLVDRRQPQIMKHEQAMNDSKNKTDTLRFAGVQPIMNRDDVFVWLSLVWLSPSAVRRSGCYFRFDG